MSSTVASTACPTAQPSETSPRLRYVLVWLDVSDKQCAYEQAKTRAYKYHPQSLLTVLHVESEAAKVW